MLDGGALRGVLRIARLFGRLRAVSITATVLNDSVKLPRGIHLPDGTRVRVELAVGETTGQGWPADYFARTAGALADEPLERPAQGSLEVRDLW